MFGFTQKKRKRHANKRKMKDDVVHIEELDTPDTPELTPYEPIVLNSARSGKKMNRNNIRLRFSRSRSHSHSRSHSRSRKTHHRRVRTPTPYPTAMTPPTLTPTPTTKPLALKSEGDMILFFIEMLNTVKLYHWKTHSFATHKATDELYDDLNKYVDEFVEVMLGYKGGIRVNLPRTSVKLNDFSTAEQFKRKLNEYKTTLISYTHKLDPNQNSDLLNIRDELLATLNKTAYLLSFR